MPIQRARSAHKAKIPHARFLKSLLVFSAALRTSALFMWQADPLEFPRAETQLPGGPFAGWGVVCEGHPDVLRNKPGVACWWDQSWRSLLALMNWKISVCSSRTSHPLVNQSCCSHNNSTSPTPLNTQPYLCQLTSRADRLQMKSCTSLSTCRMWRELSEARREQKAPDKGLSAFFFKVDGERVSCSWCPLRNMKTERASLCASLFFPVYKRSTLFLKLYYLLKYNWHIILY